MRKDKVDAFVDFILAHSKIVFPITVTAAVAVTVSVGLNANRAKAILEEDITASPVPVVMMPEMAVPNVTPQAPEVVSHTEVPAEAEPLQIVSEEVPLVLNEDGAIYTLIATYYNACALGDNDTLVSIYDALSENELLRFAETAKYLDYYPSVEIYTKPGHVEGTTLAYVYYRIRFINHEEEFPGYEVFFICDGGEGNLYIKNESNFTEEEKDYIAAVSLQDDVVEFNNRVTVEYNDMIEDKPELWVYLRELGSQVDVAVGSALVAQASEEEGQNEKGMEGEAGGEPVVPEEPVQPEEIVGPQFASTTTTVNVRSSDSEQADKIGKVTGGTRVQVQEVLINGWSKVVCEGNEGYIKSEFLQMEESVGGQEVIGLVTAIENVKIRSEASLEASSLGVLIAGETLELLGNEEGWCKVKYEDRVAYVKAEYVSQ